MWPSNYWKSGYWSKAMWLADGDDTAVFYDSGFSVAVPSGSHTIKISGRESAVRVPQNSKTVSVPSYNRRA